MQHGVIPPKSKPQYHKYRLFRTYPDNYQNYVLVNYATMILAGVLLIIKKNSNQSCFFYHSSHYIKDN